MGERINSDRVNYGLNIDLGSWKDSRYVRCSRCGFINNLDREMRGCEGSRQGWGVDLVNTTTASIYISGSGTTWGSSIWGDEGWGSGTLAVYGIDPVVTMGCSFCGTLLYNK